MFLFYFNFSCFSPWRIKVKNSENLEIINVIPTISNTEFILMKIGHHMHFILIPILWRTFCKVWIRRISKVLLSYCSKNLLYYIQIYIYIQLNI